MADATRHAILLVDDEPEILFSLRSLLRREFEVHTAEGGPEALKLLSERRVQVIMTDQRMPGMSGVEFLCRSREMCPKAIPIVFTGYADLKAVVEAVNKGHIFRYITKPWDPDDLAAVLAEAAAHYDQVDQRERLLADLRRYVGEGVTLANTCREPTSGPSRPAIPPQWAEFIQQGKNLMERLDRALVIE